MATPKRKSLGQIAYDQEKIARAALDPEFDPYQWPEYGDLPSHEKQVYTRVGGAVARADRRRR